METKTKPMSKIQRYIKKYWKNLPKSSINDLEVVIFDTVQDDEYGYGHHSYEGYGVMQDGSLVSVTSGGCSCSGSCGVSGLSYGVSKESKLMFDNYNPEFIDFPSQSVTFYD
jgi:hypothetical protein